jgi:hypothetical protein
MQWNQISNKWANGVWAKMQMGPKLNYALYTKGADRMFALVRAVEGRGTGFLYGSIVERNPVIGHKPFDGIKDLLLFAVLGFNTSHLEVPIPRFPFYPSLRMWHTLNSGA